VVAAAKRKCAAVIVGVAQKARNHSNVEWMAHVAIRARCDEAQGPIRFAS
jgi:hypothetical protein